MTSDDREYERLFVGDRQIEVTRFYAVNWTEDTERPTVFAVGYWSHDGVFHQGFVRFNASRDAFVRPTLNWLNNHVPATA